MLNVEYLGSLKFCAMNQSFLTQLYDTHQSCPQVPTPDRVGTFFSNLLCILFPALNSRVFDTKDELVFQLLNLKTELYEMLFLYPNRESINAENKAEAFFSRLEDIYSLLHTDIQAMYDGDPAAQSTNEVIRSYPGFFAIAAHRIAYVLHNLEVKIIPRMIAEAAHSKTGIDIHPGATIGKGFCIDHGTGIVIGETCHIGDFVKIYQGVTLGALSVDKEMASVKRHPTIEDHVVLYSGATILGGKTIIGHHSIIGGNTWITKSVEPNSKKYYSTHTHN